MSDEVPYTIGVEVPCVPQDEPMRIVDAWPEDGGTRSCELCGAEIPHPRGEPTNIVYRPGQNIAFCNPDCEQQYITEQEN